MTTRRIFVFLVLTVFLPLAADSADKPDTQEQIAKMLLERARDEYEIVAKAKAANRGFVERLEQHLQPYLERRDGELVYNFRRAPSGAALPTMHELQELVDWHEKAVRRHIFYSEEGIKTGVKLNDALNRMEAFTPDAMEMEEEDDNQLEAE